MQTPTDFLGVIETLTNTQNPEIWHAENMSHPGIAWVLKTVVPKVEFINDDNFEIINLWTVICAAHPNIVTTTPEAYDWDGHLLEEWSTIWIINSWDIEVSSDLDRTLSYKICKFEKGVAKQAESLIDSIGHQLAQLTNIDEQEELLELLEACEALSSYTTDQDSDTIRKKFKVIDDGV